jgi:hypothetical protein
MPQPPLPTSFERAHLEAAGFSGWATFTQLRSAYDSIPCTPLCYVVYRTGGTSPVFRTENSGGRFKGRNPTVPGATLQAKWVQDAHTLNIGKADVGRTRLKAYARFGAGEPVAHWGGRYIWQLKDADDLLVAWHEIGWVETARDYERRLMSCFRECHNGRLPFANLTS